MRSLTPPPASSSFRRTVACGLLCTAALLPGGLRAEQDAAPLDRIRDHVARIEGDLELLRLELGVPEAAVGRLSLTGVTPREALFLADGLYGRAHQLCFDLTRESMPRPRPPAIQGIEAGDTATALAGVESRLACARSALGADGPRLESASFPIDDLSDVATWIVNANRRLDRLLRRPAGPPDVFREVTLALSYSSRILGTFAGTASIPEPPPFERHRRPEHVYRRLAGCLDRVREITGPLGHPGATIEAGDELQIDPSLVLDMATLLVANLAYLHSLRPAAAPPIEPFEPGFKTPSHVFQRVGIVERQIEWLARLIDGAGGGSKGSGWSTP